MKGSPADARAETTSNDLPTVFEKAVEGDQNAFWALMQRYSGLIYSVAFGVLNDPDQSQDVLHEVYLEAYRSLHNLRHPSRLPAWLNTLTRNLCYDAYRRKSRAEHKMPEVFQHQPRVMLVYEVLVKEEELKQLESALSTLPEPFRIILGMKYMNHFSCKEIAQALEISVGAAKSRLFEARKLLARKMTEAGYENHSVVDGGSRQ